MATTFVCKSCGKRKPANIRLKGTQHYCNEKDCQRARKAAWQKEKMAKDPQYQPAARVSPRLAQEATFEPIPETISPGPSGLCQKKPRAAENTQPETLKASR